MSKCIMLRFPPHNAVVVAPEVQEAFPTAPELEEVLVVVPPFFQDVGNVPQEDLSTVQIVNRNSVTGLRLWLGLEFKPGESIAEQADGDARCGDAEADGEQVGGFFGSESRAGPD
jgi:hypothetical protein